ncbi:MAG: O-antigen ligase family protein [Clostridiales bacterium]|nr:O-antigen ligase family protein [Clostridiales bacterium]
MQSTFLRQLKNMSAIEKLRFIKDGVEKFCVSTKFPFLVAFVAFVFHALALDLVGIMTFAIFASIAFLIFKDCRPALTVTLTAIFIVSSKNSPRYQFEGDPEYYMQPSVYIPLACAVIVLIATMIFKCIKNRKNYKIGKSYIALLVLATVITLSGVGRKYYGQSFVFGLLMALSYLGIYLILTGAFDNFDGILNYIATLLSALSLLIAMQVAFLYVVHIIKGGDFDEYWKGSIVVGWGVSNIVGEMMCFFMPFVFYKIEKSKNYIAYLCILLFSMVMLIFTLNRAGMLFGFPIFVFLFIRLLVRSENRGKIFLTTVIIISTGIILLMALTAFTDLSSVFTYFEDLFDKKTSPSLSGRDQLWKQAWGYFLDSKWVGEGFARSFNEPLLINENSLFQSLSHNFIIQALGSGGIMGITGTLLFVGHMIRIYFKKYEGRVYFICYGLLFLGISLLDTTYFITYSVMFLMFMTVAVEKLIAREKSVKEQK